MGPGQGQVVLFSLLTLGAALCTVGPGPGAPARVPVILGLVSVFRGSVFAVSFARGARVGPVRSVMSVISALPRLPRAR